ncbi:MAG TPA: NYN domain-containing protein [Actinomycetaceae bacterium]|nr:NYN domain-containing protein [Actinomycetaceae bacterium]
MDGEQFVTPHTGDDVPPKFAVLIDADNAQAANIEGLLAEIASYGEATVRRIYGDFTSTHSAQWKKVLNKYAIKPVQQFAYTTGKNATDSTMIIDAMDLLYTRKFDGFCLVSSDSDFTGLALRIREEGLMVLGFGERKTPESFRNACHKFIFTDLLEKGTGRRSSSRAPLREPAAEETVGASSTQVVSADPGPEPVPLDFLRDALDKTSDETGWAPLSALGSYATKVQPDFDPRTYGFKKLSDLVRAQSEFELKERALPGSGTRVLSLRAGKVR